MEKNKKKKVIINSSLVGILGVSTTLATAVTLTSCAGGDKEAKKVPVFDNKVNKEINATFNDEHSSSTNSVYSRQNVFKIRGTNLNRIDTELLNIKQTNGTTVPYELISKTPRIITIEIKTVWKKDMKLKCYYGKGVDKELIGNLLYKAHPVFTNDINTPIKISQPNSTEFAISGQNLNFLNKENLKITDATNKPIEYEILPGSTSGELKVLITTKIYSDMKLYCQYDNKYAVVLDYVEPRPVGVSEFITNWRRDDKAQLNTNVRLPDQKIQTHSDGGNGKVILTDQYYKTTNQFRTLVNKEKSKLQDYAKIVSQEKLKKIFGEDYLDKYDILMNINDKNGIFTISGQVNDKNQFPLIPTREINPYLGFKFEFDFRNASVDINDQNILVFRNIKITSSFDNNGNISTKENYINLNDDTRILNNEILGIVPTQTANKEIKEWNREKLGNASFIATLKQNITNQMNKNIDVFKYFFDLIQNIGDLIVENKPIKDFLYGLKEPVIKFLNLADANPSITLFIEHLLDEKVKPGKKKDTEWGTYYGDLYQLKQQKIIGAKLYDQLKTFCGALFGKPLITFILELPTVALNTVIEKIKPKLKPKLVPIVEAALVFIQNIKKLIPQGGSILKPNNIGMVHVLDAIAAPSMKDELLNLADKIFEVLLSKDKLSDIRKLRSIWHQVSWNVPNLQSTFRGIFYPTVNGQEMKLSDYFKTYTRLTAVQEEVIPNADLQTFKMNSTYKLEFLAPAKISLGGIIKMVETIKLTTILKTIGKPVHWLIGWLVNAIGKVGKALPDYIWLNSQDSVTFKIHDNNAFLVPKTNGYRLRAKQMFSMDFTRSLTKTYEDLLDKWGFIIKKKIKKYLGSYVDTLKNYYMQANYWTDVAGGIIKDDANALKNKENIFDGKNALNINNDKINRIKTIVIPYIRSWISNANPNLDLTFDLPEHIKRQVLIEMGLDPEAHIKSVKMIVSMTPGFMNGAASNNKPSMGNVDLNMAFAESLLVQVEGNIDAEIEPGVDWVNSFEIPDISI